MGMAKKGKVVRGTGGAKSSTNDEYATFSNALRRILQVPHSELKKRIEAEKKTKKRMTVTPSASHA